MDEKLRAPKILVTSAWALLFAVLGILGNVLALPLGFGVTFIFGSVFGLMAVVLLGPPGIVVSLIAASYTVVLWNHSYAIVIFGAEALWLLLVLKSKPTASVFVIDFAFWCVVGVPLVFLFYFGALDLDLGASGFVAVKQSLNGVCNAVLVSVLLNLLPIRRWLDLAPAPLPSTSRVFFEGMAFLLMVPCVGGLIYVNHLDIQRTEESIATRVARTAYEASWNTSAWLDRHERATRQLAAKGAEAGFVTSDRLQNDVVSIHELFPGFHNVLVADGTSRTVAFNPTVNEEGEPTLGLTFADREWFKRLKATGEPVISDVFMGRGGVFEPIFSISTPVLRDGKLVGFGLGAVNLGRMESFLHAITDHSGVTLTLLDRNRRIIITTHPARATLETLTLEAVEGEEPIVPGVRLCLPLSGPDISAMRMWEGALLFTEVPITRTGWTLVAEGPVGPLQQRVYDSSIWNLSAVFLLLFVAMGVSYGLSRRLTGGLSGLAAVTGDLPHKIETDRAIEWPRAETEEVRLLTENFETTGEVLRSKLNDLKGHSQALELEVRSRTAELQSSNDKFRVLFDNEVYAICIFDHATLVFLDVNRAYEGLYGYTRSELLGGMTIHDITAEHESTDAATQQAKTEGTVFIPLRSHKRKTGEVFPVEIVVGPYEWNGKTVMFALAHDISERVEAETALRESEARWQFALEGAGEGVWDWHVATGEAVFSRQWKALIGYEDSEIGVSLGEWESRVHPDDIARCQQDLERHMRAETDVYVNEHRLLCKGGSYKWTLGRGKVIERDTDGKPLRVIGTQSDISRQKEAEERLSGYAESQRILLREVNHRVKNNLALIIGMVHMETRKAGDGPTDGILGAIEGRIQALSVVHSMLSSTEWRPIVLQVLCEQIVKGTIAPSRNAQVTISRSDVVVMASRAHNVALVMHELATNTCKHASGQEQLCVDIEVVAQGNDVLLKYRDSGPGFSKEVIAGDSRALGTGLKLLRGIVEMSLGGEIRFSNQDGAVAEIRFNAEILEDEGHAG